MAVGHRAFVFVVLLAFIACKDGVHGAGMLHPRESESRQVQELNGMWDFRADTSPQRNAGFVQKWFSARLSQSGDVIPMPVPSSYNDITTRQDLRDFVGWAWYDRVFYPPNLWTKQRVVLRFESCHYNAIVWVNGKQIMTHEGGHLPFEAVVTSDVDFGKSNWITVAVNNTLTPETLPPGSITYKGDPNSKPPFNPAASVVPTPPWMYPANYFVQNVQFDFFNYAGIHRQVRLYMTPLTYIDDITITSSIQGSTGLVNYEVITGGPEPISRVSQILDAEDNIVATQYSLHGQFILPHARFWWPYTMSDDYAYQYTLLITIQNPEGVFDRYRQKFGIRTVRTTSSQILINDKPFYCHGVNKHEDADIRGKGVDLPTIARDFSLMKWLGANCFRTSHYPYAEEIMDMADAEGFAVIDECPGVGIKKKENMGNVSLAHHLAVMAELVRRDKNRPGVIMWSIANEPASNIPEAENYFSAVVNKTRSLDPIRPVTFVCSEDFDKDRVAKYVDVLCINRYYGWYSDSGHPEVIQLQLTYDLNQWYDKLHKPLIISEYGADTVAGLHTLPSQMFTEDYQVDFMRAYHHVFDDLRHEFLVGELVWNFADFMTTQSVTRVVGNKKGIFTRQREPKPAAFDLRNRYNSIINETKYSRHFDLDNVIHREDSESDRLIKIQALIDEHASVLKEYENIVLSDKSPLDDVETLKATWRENPEMIQLTDEEKNGD